MKIIDFQDDKSIKKDVKRLFLSAFPSDERPPVWLFFKSFENPNNRLYAFYEEKTFVGFVSLILYKDICYLFFLAVSPELRNKGYGSQILSEMKKLYKDRVLLLCFEEVDKKYKDYENRLKRAEFYAKNGFKDNNLKTNEFGVVFQTAYIGNHKVSFEDYQNIFASGFGEFAMKHLKKVKTICCIGDSLTEGDYGVYGKTCIANVQEKNYPYFLFKLSGCTVKNFGYCGYRASNILDKFDEGAINVTGADVIVILLGTNGGFTPNEETVDTKAYKEIINRCHKQAPEARIIICTPPHVTTNPKKAWFGLYDTVDSAAKFVRKFGAENNLEVLDLFSDNHFNDGNEDIMQPNDGCHFSEVGYQTLAKIIYEDIKKYL